MFIKNDFAEIDFLEVVGLGVSIQSADIDFDRTGGGNVLLCVKAILSQRQQTVHLVDGGLIKAGLARRFTNGQLIKGDV